MRGCLCGIVDVCELFVPGRRSEPYHLVNSFSVRDSQKFRVEDEDPDEGDLHQPDGWVCLEQPGLPVVTARSPEEPMEQGSGQQGSTQTSLGINLGVKGMKLSTEQAQTIKNCLKGIAKVLKEVSGESTQKPPRNIIVPPPEKGSLDCTVCGRELSSKATLKRHLQTHRKIFRHQCGTCGYGCQLKQELKLHELGHKTKLRCRVAGCESVLSSRKAMTTHMKDHRRRHETQGKKTPCRFCGREYAAERYAKSHEVDCPDNPNYQGPYVCLYAGCSRSYTAKKERARHMKSDH